MVTTGAANRHPAANPAGISWRAQSRKPARPVTQSGGPSCLRDAWRPVSVRTAAAGSAVSSSRRARVMSAQLAARSSMPTRCGPQIAPAAAEVVWPAGTAAAICTIAPASARQTAVVSPDTPAPITRMSGSLPLI